MMGLAQGLFGNVVAFRSLKVPDVLREGESGGEIGYGGGASCSLVSLEMSSGNNNGEGGCCEGCGGVMEIIKWTSCPQKYYQSFVTAGRMRETTPDENRYGSLRNALGCG